MSQQYLVGAGLEVTPTRHRYHSHWEQNSDVSCRSPLVQLSPTKKNSHSDNNRPSGHIAGNNVHPGSWHYELLLHNMTLRTHCVLLTALHTNTVQTHGIAHMLARYTCITWWQRTSQHMYLMAAMYTKAKRGGQQHKLHPARKSITAEADQKHSKQHNPCVCCTSTTPACPQACQTHILYCCPYACTHTTLVHKTTPHGAAVASHRNCSTSCTAKHRQPTAPAALRRAS